MTAPATTHTPPDLSFVYAIHGALRRDAQAIADVVRDLRPEDRAHRIPAIREYVAAFTNQLVAHHTHEDEVFFPALVARVGRDAAHLSTLVVQHHRLDATITRLTTALATVGDDRTGFEAAKAEAGDAAQALVDEIAEHLALEEGTVFPVYQAAITFDEQIAMEARVQAMGTFEDLCFMIPWLFDAIPAQPREAVLAGLPEFLRTVYADHASAYRVMASCLKRGRS